MTQPAQPAQPTQSTQNPIDTRVMATLHSMFRREFRLAGGVVRRVADGDRARAAVVAKHLAFVAKVLHHHHTVEDDLLWPILLERVPDEIAPLVHLMESQHQTVDALLAEIDEAVPRWAANPSARERAILADLLDRLYVHLAEHLDAEEQRMMPIVSRAITEAEWEALGEAGREGGKGKEALLAMGMFQHDGEPAAIALMLADAPPPVRWLLPRLARRAFRKHALEVHGTATP